MDHSCPTKQNIIQQAEEIEDAHVNDGEISSEFKIK